MSKKRQKSAAAKSSAPAPAPQAQAPVEAPSAGPQPLFSSQEIFVLGAILLFGFLLRAGYLLELRQAPDYNFPMNDAAFKDQWARAILSGKTPVIPGQLDPQLDTTPYIRPPAYPFFLAFVYLLTGGSIPAVIVLQMGAGLFNVVLFYLLARSLFGRAVGYIGAALMSCYWIFIFFEGIQTEVTLNLTLLLAIFYFMRLWLVEITTHRIVVPGVLFGILALARTESLLFLPVLLAWGGWALRDRMPAARLLKTLGIFAACVALAIAPVTLRNYLRTGEFVSISLLGGLNVYAGHNPRATGEFPELDYQALFGISQTLSHNNFPQLLEGLRNKTGDPSLGFADLDRFFTREAMKYVLANPLHTIGLELRKLGLFWGPAEISSNEMQTFDRRYSNFLWALPGFPFAAGGFALGVALWLRRKAVNGDEGVQRKIVPLLLLFVAAVSATHIIFFVVGRFRVPVIPILLLFTAYAIWQIGRMLVAQQFGAAGRWLLAGLALQIVFRIQWAPYEPDVVRWHYIRGIAYGANPNLPPDHVDRAIAEFKLALKATPTPPSWLLSELGFAYSVKGENDQAATWLQKAVEINPNDTETRMRLGGVLMAANRLPEALDQFRKAVDLDFTNNGARFHMAGILSDLGRHDEAEAQLKQLMERAPDYPGMQRRHGQILSAMGQHEEAMAAFKAAIESNPSDYEAHNALGFEYARQGKLDEAAAAYQKALDAKPDFCLAHNNLGDLLAHKGELDNAMMHFVEALNINPRDAYGDYGWAYCLWKKNDIPRAMDRLRANLGKNPGHVDAHNLLGYLLMGEGKMEEAEKELRRAIELDSKFILAHQNLAELLRRTGRPEDSLKELDRVVTLNPGNAEVRAQADTLRTRLQTNKIQVPEGGKVLHFP